MPRGEVATCRRLAQCDLHLIDFQSIFYQLQRVVGQYQRVRLVIFSLKPENLPYTPTSFFSISSTLLACSHTGGPGGPGDPRNCIACPSGEYSIPKARSFRCNRASNGYKHTNTITTRAVYGRLRYGGLPWYNTRTCGGVAVVVRRR